MTDLQKALANILVQQERSKRPLAVILAGHNGSGKTTLWDEQLADTLQMPLINADRMMLSILPSKVPLPEWAVNVRDTHEGWMKVAQKGVEAFVAQAMDKKVPFAMETVFSHWVDRGNGKFESKIDKIRELRKAGYFVLLLFVGLTNKFLSVARVEKRVADKGHDVPIIKLISRFPRTQKAIRNAVEIADASILVDNSRKEEQAFTLCRVQMKKEICFDLRGLVCVDGERRMINRPGSSLYPYEIAEWMELVCPLRLPYTDEPTLF